MSRKIVYQDPFISPTPEEVREVVEFLGGKAEVARICKKNWCTVDRWCSGTYKIDYANWKLICEKCNKTGETK
jgi:hypothetical protein